MRPPRRPISPRTPQAVRLAETANGKQTFHHAGRAGSAPPAFPLDIRPMTTPARDRATAPPRAAAPTDGGPDLPPDLLRAGFTAALCFYLFGLLLTIAGNSSSGSSPLVRTLVNRLYAPWMTPAWLDLGFDYRLTHGGAADGDFELEVSPWGGADEARVRRFPGGLAGERADRWRRLARTIASAGDDDRGGLLAAAAARGLFAEVGGRDLAVRVLRRPPWERGAPEPVPAKAYAARVRLLAGDENQLLREEPREELAPVVGPAAGSDGSDTDRERVQ